MKDLYFVSYAHKNGFGCCEMWADNGGFKVKEVIKAIEKKNPNENEVIILYFKRFENGESY